MIDGLQIGGAAPHEAGQQLAQDAPRPLDQTAAVIMNQVEPVHK
jgi:hypothetical protein